MCSLSQTAGQENTPEQMIAFFDVAGIGAKADTPTAGETVMHCVISLDTEVENQFAADAVPNGVAYYIEGYNRPREQS